MLDKSVIQDEQALSGQTSRCATRGRVQEVAGTLSLDNSPRASSGCFFLEVVARLVASPQNLRRRILSRHCQSFDRSRTTEGQDSRNFAHHAGSELSVDVTNGAKSGPGAKGWGAARGSGNVFRDFGARGGSQASQPLRTSRTALGMLNPSACTTFRMRAKLALSYSVAS